MKTQHNKAGSPLFAFFCLLALGSFLGPWAALGKWDLVWALGICWVLFPFPRPNLLLERLKQFSFWLLALFLGLYLGQPQPQPSGDRALEHYNCKEFEAIGCLIKPLRSNGFSKKTWIEIYVSRKNTEWQPTAGKVMLSIPLEDSTALETYDVIHFKGKMTTMYSSYPSYLSYLNKKGIGHQVYVEEIEILGREKGIMAEAYLLQQRRAKTIDVLFPDSVHAGLIKAMMLGEKRDLDREVRRDFATAGISHVLAISGMHVGIIYLILDKLLFLLAYIRRGYLLKQVLIFLCLGSFMFISGANPAVVRATLMFGGIILAKITRQRYQSLNIVSLTGILQLLFQPGLIHDLGFQLSYAAVLGLIILYPWWEKQFSTGSWWKDALNGWVGITLIATLATAPLIWMNFGTFPTYFLLTNILVSFLVTLLVWVGFLCVLLGSVPMINLSLAWIASFLIDGLLGIIGRVSHLPFSVLERGEDLWAGLRVLLIELLVGAILVVGLSGKWGRRLGSKKLRKPQSA